MRFLLFIIIFVFFNCHIFADWQKLDNIEYNLPYIYNIELFNDGIIANSRKNIFNLEKGSDSWQRLESESLESFVLNYGLIGYGDTLIASLSPQGVIFSSNKGKDWTENKFSDVINRGSNFRQNEDYIYFIRGYLYRVRKNDFTKIDTLPIKLSNFIENLFVKDSIVLVSTIQGQLANGGIFISLDEGNSFEKVYNNDYVYNVLINDDNVIVASISTAIISSKDMGKTWKVVPIQKSTKFIETLNGKFYVVTNDNEIIVFDSDLEILDRLKQNNDNPDIMRYNCGVAYENSIYLGTWNGIYRLDAETLTFELFSPKGTNTNLFFVKNIDDMLYYSGFLTGIKYSTDNGQTWEVFSKSLDSIEKSTASRFEKKGNMVIGCRYDSYPFYTSVDMENWNVIRSGYGAISNVGIIDNKFYFLSDNGLYLSDEQGLNWEKIFDLTNDDGFDITLHSVINYNGSLFVGSKNNGVLKSSTLGQDWVACEFEDESYKFNKVTKIVESNDELKLILTDYKDDNFLYEYDFDQNEWQKLSDLGNMIIYDFKFYGQTLFLTLQDYGFMYSNDNGVTTNLRNEGLNEEETAYMREFTFFNNKIYVANSEGIYYRSFSDFGFTSVESEIDYNYLYTFPTYPLPTQNEVKVKFYWDINIPMGIDDISIYDISGRKVKTKDNLRLEKQASHYGNLIWDCSDEQAGIYIINISHGTEERAIKVVVE